MAQFLERKQEVLAQLGDRSTRGAASAEAVSRLSEALMALKDSLMAAEMDLVTQVRNKGC